MISAVPDASVKFKAVMITAGPKQLCSDGHGTHDDSIFKHHTEHQEHKVEYKHDGSQHFIHPPLTGSDGNNDEEKHKEEQYDGAEEPVTAHLHRSKRMADREHQPRHRQPAKELNDGYTVNGRHVGCCFVQLTPW